jgi:serine/threonine protein phosphatase PrpC
MLLVGQRGKVKLQTISHSPVGYAVEAGYLDAEEAMLHEDRHYVTNTLGSPDMRIEIGTPVAMAARDTLLLASDGLFDNLYVGEIVDLVRKGPLVDAAARLLATCRGRMAAVQEGRPSKSDDLTFVLYRRKRAPARSGAGQGER